MTETRKFVKRKTDAAHDRSDALEADIKKVSIPVMLSRLSLEGFAVLLFSSKLTGNALQPIALFEASDPRKVRRSITCGGVTL